MHTLAFSCSILTKLSDLVFHLTMCHFAELLMPLLSAQYWFLNCAWLEADDQIVDD